MGCAWIGTYDCDRTWRAEGHCRRSGKYVQILDQGNKNRHMFSYHFVVLEFTGSFVCVHKTLYSPPFNCHRNTKKWGLVIFTWRKKT